MHFSLVEKLGASALLCAWLVYGADFLGGTVGARARASSDHGGGQAPAGGAKPGAPAHSEADLGTLLAAATPDEGEKVFNKCKACHTIEQGGPEQGRPEPLERRRRPEGAHAGLRLFRRAGRACTARPGATRT